MKQSLLKLSIATILFIVLQISSVAQSSNAPYTVPVVFHIIHNNGPENIPDSTITNMISKLNVRFGTADTTGVVAPFVNIVANMQIGFCLAQTDPQGGPTTGIDRIVDTMTYHGDDAGAKLNQWPQNKYLNIWIVNSGNGVQAYATSPLQADIAPQLDGIMSVYSLYTQQGGDLTLTKMIGKYLNLTNTWGNTSAIGVTCGDDSVSDTPPTKGSVQTCNLAQNICDVNTIENVQNYMDFSSCPCMFTNGQKQRVHAALDSTQGNRNNLWSAANLASTCSSPTGLKELSTDNIIVAPNPFSGEVTISNLKNELYSYEINDVAGRKILSKNNVVVSGRMTLDLSGLGTGMYTLTLRHANNTQVVKLVKEK